MPAPSPLAVATASVLRLLKEESSYHTEMRMQEKRIANFEHEKSSDENAEFQLRQEKRALEETKAVFPPLRQRIMAAATHLEQQLNNAEAGAADADAGEVTRAQSALDQAQQMNSSNFA